MPDPRDAPLYSIAKHKPLNFTERHTSGNATSYGYEILRSTAEMTCKPHSVLYDVTVSFPRGIQTVQHTTSDVKLLSPMRDCSALPSDRLKHYGLVWGQLMFLLDPQSLQDSNQRMRNLVSLSNEWALLDALGSLLEDEFYSSPAGNFGLYSDNPCFKESNISTNGTTYIACGRWNESVQFPVINASSKWERLACFECRI
jgi:hypothetical protein